MERWVPLFTIFLNSPTPETEASLWLKQSFDALSSTPITTSSFMSLLANPVDAIVSDSSPSSKKRVMFIQTLPDMVQARILSFLAIDRERFCKRDLCGLVRGLLRDKGEIDFWVKKAAHHLLDEMSEPSYEWVSAFSLDSPSEKMDEELESLPGWLRNEASANELFLPWLPVSPDELNANELFGSHRNERDLSSQVGVDRGDILKEVAEEMEVDLPVNAPLEQEIKDMAASLRGHIMSFKSRAETDELGNEICRLCLTGRRDAFEVLSLIEPWRADDETASLLISYLSTRNEEVHAWPSQVLCSIVLPKFLVLEEPASRVLVSATVDYCKTHQRAAEYALFFPLIMRSGGINSAICEVLARIIKESFHPAHVSSFCMKLLCEEGGTKSIYLPCHQDLISSKLVWTEALFSLFHNILNLNVQLTEDSVDELVRQIQEMAQTFSKSLKFGNFLLCFITKCYLLLHPHKHILTEAVEKTNTLVTKSLLSKLASF